MSATEPAAPAINRAERLVLAIRALAVVLVLAVLGRGAALALGPLSGANSGLVLLELGLLGGILVLSVMFFERVMVRLVRTRGGRRQGRRYR